MNSSIGTAAGFLLLLINIASCFQLNIPQSRLISDDANINEKPRTDSQYLERTKRALPISVYKVLSKAKFTGTNHIWHMSVHRYEKKGGFKQALKDFKSVKFTATRQDVNRVPHTWQIEERDSLLNPVWIGDVGMTRLELQKYPAGAKAFDATISIWQPWTSALPQKIIYYQSKSRP